MESDLAAREKERERIIAGSGLDAGGATLLG
jgi:hypothetical protein